MEKIVKIYQMFEEDTGNLLEIAVYAMEKIPLEIQKELGITSDYLFKLKLIGSQLLAHQIQQEETSEKH
jgi:hypothetical protein|tara:strand:- start:981 stop:1187 length:207 start_codon:yes stop_codon:yes gene_type:complete